MKWSKPKILGFLFSLSLLLSCAQMSFAQQADQSLSVLVITGGHDFDRKAFFDLMDGLKGIKWTEVQHPHANRHFTEAYPTTYDVLLFYDMVQEINEDEKAGLARLVENGIGLLFLHHALVSYQDWDKYKEWVGGRYIEKGHNDHPSNYQHEVHFPAITAAKSHPIVEGLTDFQIFDEVYGNVYISDKVTPLIKTDHPASMPLLAWCQQLGKSRSVYIQRGHGPEVYGLAAYRKLLSQAIGWAGRRQP